jgi:hypothetical protein
VTAAEYELQPYLGGVHMIRGILKLVLVIVILVGVVAFFLGRRTRAGGEFVPDKPSATHGPIDSDRARDAGAKVGEAVGNAATQAQDALATGSITAKIKSKMALDELVKARNIDVDTSGTVVTLTGVVESESERRRALQLANETEGVTKVIDRLRIR